MLLKNLIVPLLATTATVSATFDLTSSLTKYASFDFGCGDISISKGASFSLIDKFDAAFQGDISIDKDCDFFLASTAQALKVSIDNLFSKVVNKGRWVILTIEASKECIINIAGAKLENIGNLICAIEAKKVALISTIIKNVGCIHIHQNQCTDTTVQLGCVGGSIENSGTVCLTNYKAKAFAPIKGSGCIAIEQDSHFEIGDWISIDKDQTFYLGASKGSIKAAPGIIPQVYKVANFGKEKKISLTTPLGGISILKQAAFSYDSGSGILTLRAGLQIQKFFIGKGYDSSKFSICKDDNTAVQYNGDCPSPGRPAVCQPCPPPPEVPGTEPCTSTTTIHTTKTDGQICTKYENVVISTHGTGNWFTSTSTSMECGQTSQATSIPNTQVTVTSTYTGVTTATTTVTGVSTDTVIVEVPSTPNPQVTTTTTSEGITEVTATTITGVSTDTVIVVCPPSTTSYTTYTNTWTGSYTTTTTASDIVVVEVPDTSSTTSSSSTSSTAPTTTATTSTTTDTDIGGFSTSYVTVTAETTEIVTITSCANNGCHQTTATTGVTVITVTESDISTVITTYCPLTQTHTLGVSSSSTVDLGCPTGWFGFDGLPGKNIHFDFQKTKSIGFYIDINKFHKRDDSNSSSSDSSSSSSSAAAGAMNTVYGVEFLSAIAIVFALVF